MSVKHQAFLIRWFADAVADVNKRAKVLREQGAEINFTITKEGEISANIEKRSE